MNREQNFRRYSMNIPNVEQERLQGWLTIANAVETGQYSETVEKRATIYTRNVVWKGGGKGFKWRCGLF